MRHSFDDHDARLDALGQQLVQIHDGLRDQLGDLLDSLDDHDGVSGQDGPDLDGLRSLRSHCLAFCSALGEHHTREDGVFPMLLARAPELAPLIENLRRDHEFISGILGRVESLLRSVGPGTDVAPVRAELGGLAALMENHFAYEERQLASALSGTGSPDRS